MAHTQPHAHHLKFAPTISYGTQPHPRPRAPPTHPLRVLPLTVEELSQHAATLAHALPPHAHAGCCRSRLRSCRSTCARSRATSCPGTMRWRMSPRATGTRSGTRGEWGGGVRCGWCVVAGGGGSWNKRQVGRVGSDVGPCGRKGLYLGQFGNSAGQLGCGGGCILQRGPMAMAIAAAASPELSPKKLEPQHLRRQKELPHHVLQV